MPVREDILAEYADSSEHTLEQLQETDAKIEKAIQENLHDHFDSSKLSGGYDYWLLESRGGLDNGVWLALNEFEIAEQLREGGIEYDIERVRRVAYASLEEAQSLGWTIEVGGGVARSYKDPFFFPIYVRFPNGWEAGERHLLQRFVEFISRYEMSPAESLDYIATTQGNFSNTEWSGIRDVEPEAVRKNVRQAKEKLTDDVLGASHEKATLRAVSVDEIPEDGPHDPDKDKFYIPTDPEVTDKE